MRFLSFLRKLLPAAVVILILGAGALTYDTWKSWLLPGKSSDEAGEEEGHDHAGHAHGAEERIRLSPQARANLRLLVKPVELKSYLRSIPVPGVVAERPDQGDRGVTAPIGGVVTHIAVVPGDSVKPGDELFTLRLLSETLQSSQAQLYKTVRDLEINEREQKRLTNQSELFKARIIELGYEKERLLATMDSVRHELLARGLTSAEIEGVTKGRFLTEAKINVPNDDKGGRGKSPSDAVAAILPVTAAPNANQGTVYQVEELKVKLGEQVQAGQMLAQLANHQALYIEGQGFEEDTAFLERATQQGWPLRAEFVEEAGSNWPVLNQELKIRFLGTKIDPTSRTFPFYVPLANQYREREASGGKTTRLWRYRPGQRVRLDVPVEEFKDVFVLPAEAIVREGPEVYVFRANGDLFQRKPVHVLFEDSRNVVIANDGSITTGNQIAQNGAVQLNRALKAAGAGAHDPHAGHMH